MENFEIIAKHLAGETTEKEEALVQEWLAEKPDNRKELERFRHTLEVAGQSLQKIQPDVAEGYSQVWKKIRAQQEDEHGGSTPVIQLNRGASYWVKKVAAVLVAGLLLATIAFLAHDNFSGQSIAYQEQSTDQAGTAFLLLADGSKVWLNKNSSLRYPDEFEGASREVYLSGEAYFEIEHQPDAPFIIHTGKTITRVLGTSFSLREQPGQVSVTVATGKVAFYTEGDTETRLVLEPMDRGTYFPKGRKLQKSQVADQNHLAWKTGELSFNNTPLLEVEKVLNHCYGQKISIKNGRDIRVSAKFEQQTLQQVLQVLQEITNENILFEIAPDAEEAAE